MIILNINYLKFILLLILISNKLLLMAARSKFSVPQRLEGNNVTVFNILQAVQNEYNPVNLGTGSPDFDPPNVLRSALANAIWGNYSLSQYSKTSGEPRLRKALAKFYSQLLNRTLDPEKNVFITVGATEAIFATINAHTSPGDEWIIFEPYFNNYVPSVKAAFGFPRIVTLQLNKTGDRMTSSDWTFNRKDLENAFNNKTKGILINNPHNPSGKVFTREELEFIADLAKKWDTIVLSDEVYEFLIYDNEKHIRIATLPDMFHRTITISSGSKTFCAPGYRLGWLYGGAEIVNNLNFLQGQLLDSVATPIQDAFAATFEQELLDLGKPNSYLNRFRDEAEKKRNYLIKIIIDFGMIPIIPQAGYFLIANLTSLEGVAGVDYNKEIGDFKDHKFIKWMIKNARLQGFPLSSFYSSEHKHIGEDGVRFTFIKTAETLQKVEDNIAKWKLQNS